MRDHERLLDIERGIERLGAPLEYMAPDRRRLGLVPDPLPILQPAAPKGRRRDSVAVGVCAVVFLLAVAVGTSIAMGWLR